MNVVFITQRTLTKAYQDMLEPFRGQGSGASLGFQSLGRVGLNVGSEKLPQVLHL